MKKRMLFVYNPHAGKARIRSNLLDIIDVFVKAGYEVTVYPTQQHGDATKAVTERDGSYSMVACSGGDGTLNEVISGMMQSEKKLPIGYVPAGSTNDFAASLSIPGNMLSAANVVVSGKGIPCDIGSFNKEYFVYVAAFGLFTDVAYETDQNLKNALGHFAYVMEGARRIGAIQSYHMRIKYNDEEIEDDFAFGMITNSKSVGGVKNITGRSVKLDDGLFEVTLVKTPSQLMELQEILIALMSGKGDMKNVRSFKTDHLIFNADQDVAWTLDGEFGGSLRYVEITNNNRAVEMIVP